MIVTRSPARTRSSSRADPTGRSSARSIIDRTENPECSEATGATTRVTRAEVSA
jgi:hypothetical protein